MPEPQDLVDVWSIVVALGAAVALRATVAIMATMIAVLVAPVART